MIQKYIAQKLFDGRGALTCFVRHAVFTHCLLSFIALHTNMYTHYSSTVGVQHVVFIIVVLQYCQCWHVVFRVVLVLALVVVRQYCQCSACSFHSSKLEYCQYGHVVLSVLVCSFLNWQHCQCLSCSFHSSSTLALSVFSMQFSWQYCQSLACSF